MDDAQQLNVVDPIYFTIIESLNAMNIDGRTNGTSFVWLIMRRRSLTRDQAVDVDGLTRQVYSYSLRLLYRRV